MSVVEARDKLITLIRWFADESRNGACAVCVLRPISNQIDEAIIDLQSASVWDWRVSQHQREAAMQQPEAEA